MRLLEEEFSPLHALWVERHLAVLTNLREVFGNDLDKPIILAVIGQFMHENAGEISHRYRDHLDPAQQVEPRRLTNIESVASSAGLPRESVRRKVGDLIDVGWVQRDSKGGLLVTTKAAEALDAVTRQTFRLQADMFVAMASLLKETGVIEIIRPALQSDD